MTATSPISAGAAAPAQTEAERLGLSFWEFVAIVAFAMSITALSVDIMLVALPDIGTALSVVDDNDRQHIVLSYMLGFAAGHLIVGPASDRFGRKPVLLIGLAVYAVAAAAATFAGDFTTMLVARVVQGLGGSAPRVVAVAVVRDRFEGRAMARVMSFVMMLFILVPVVAPSIGSLVLMVGSWRWIFAFLLVCAVALAIWIARRLPETHPAAPGGPGVLEAFSLIFRSRVTVGYTIAVGFIFGVILSYIASAQQLFADVYGIVDAFPLYFASVSLMMVVAALSNANLVRTLGMRRLSHGALIGLCATTLTALVPQLVGVSIGLVAALATLSAIFFFIGLILPNANALAMEPIGRVAGTGSSIIGFYMTGAGAALGGAVAQAFDGTLLPFSIGAAALSAAALVTVVLTEPRLFMRPAPQRAGGN